MIVLPFLLLWVAAAVAFGMFLLAAVSMMNRP